MEGPYQSQNCQTGLADNILVYPAQYPGVLWSEQSAWFGKVFSYQSNGMGAQAYEDFFFEKQLIIHR